MPLYTGRPSARSHRVVQEPAEEPQLSKAGYASWPNPPQDRARDVEERNLGKTHDKPGYPEERMGTPQLFQSGPRYVRECSKHEETMDCVLWSGSTGQTQGLLYR